jgi:hypothetical protein
VPYDIPAFLTLGLHNILLVASTAKEKNALKKFLNNLENVTPWEQWSIAKNVIQPLSVKYSPVSHQNSDECYDNGAINLPQGLTSMAEEYRTLVAATRAKGKKYLPRVSEEIAIFDKNFRARLQSPVLSDVVKSQWLVNVNAALSRFSSQTFAGTSPILGTECHFWTHSLLGIGMAAQGLLAIRRQVHSVAAQANFRGKLKQLEQQPPHQISRLETLEINNEFWQKHHLADEIEGLRINSANKLPIIVCFSGRDGFRSTTYTLSVPLEVITASNTVGWTLRTVTHELSHIFLDRILTAILPNLNSEKGLKELFKLMDDKALPASLFQQLQAYLCYALCLVVAKPDAKVINIRDANHLDQLIQESYQEASEVLTHIFDFLYFYQRDPKIYISAIWGSWDVIPNIQDRIDDYLMRTLCALLVRHLNVVDPLGTAIEEVLVHLRDLRTHFPNGVYVGEAIARLENRKDEFRMKLHHYQHLSKLSYAFLYSPSIAALLNRVEPESRSTKSIKSKLFEKNRRINNPLAFIYDYAGSSTFTNAPDPKKSVWIMAQLAFSLSQNDR